MTCLRKGRQQPKDEDEPSNCRRPNARRKEAARRLGRSPPGVKGERPFLQPRGIQAPTPSMPERRCLLVWRGVWTTRQPPMVREAEVRGLGAAGKAIVEGHTADIPGLLNGASVAGANTIHAKHPPNDLTRSGHHLDEGRSTI
jgi:hypothetical protein